MNLKFIVRSALSLLAFSPLALAVPAVAAEATFDSYYGWLSVGTTYNVNEGHAYWLGEFSGTSTSSNAPEAFRTIAWQCPGWFDVDFPNGRLQAGGYCTATVATGDVFYLAWTCGGSLAGATGKGPFPFGADNACDGSGTITGGTGALSGISGGNALKGFTFLFHPDGKGSGYTMNEWRVTLP